ncbi:MAG: class I SAM-dependent methyltransferase [Rhodanobacteraceae bacterium]
MNNQRDFYTREAASYEAKRYGSRYGRLFRALHREAVARGLSLSQRPEHILDVASGTGQMLPVFAASGAMVVAGDLTPAMLKEARNACVTLERIDYCVADATQLPYAANGFDVVASSRFLHLFEPSMQQLLLQEMTRVVKPGGVLIVDFYSADARRVFSWPIRLYRALLRKRPENDYRVGMNEARAMIESTGMRLVHVEGIGNFSLVPLLWMPSSWLMRIAKWLGRNFVHLSEQFLMVARKP